MIRLSPQIAFPSASRQADLQGLRSLGLLRQNLSRLSPLHQIRTISSIRPFFLRGGLCLPQLHPEDRLRAGRNSLMLVG